MPPCRGGGGVTLGSMSRESREPQPLPTEPTLEDWRALARSGPWRWSELTAVLTDHSTGVPGAHPMDRVRLHLVRGASLAHVETPGGAMLQVGDEPTGDRWAHREDGRAELVSPASGWGGAPGAAERQGAARERDRRDRARLYELDHPPRRKDGLVATRGLLTVPDPPYWSNYFVTALLDPVELADGREPDEQHLNPTARPAGVELLGPVRVHERHGRLTWTAELLPTADYEPRCGCCALVTDHGVARDEYGKNAAARGWDAATPGPRRAVISLDVEAAAVTYLRIEGGPEHGRQVTLDIEHVTPA